MDPMKQVAAGAVRKNLGPDPSMGRKVELLRRLVSMRQDKKGPVAMGQPVGRPYPGQSRRPRGGSVPTRLPARKPADLASQPGYTFGRS